MVDGWSLLFGALAVWFLLMWRAGWNRHFADRFGRF
jgi:hypothetical protein